MTTLPLSSIVIDRPTRQRRKLASIEALADSISRAGLINPPVVTREGVLVAGERRITAMRNLGWTATPVTYTDELDPAALALIELEENISRENIHWKDETNAVVEYHRLRSGEAGWSLAALAKALGRSPAAISNILAVARELQAGNMLVADAAKMSVALGLAQRAAERRRADEQVGMLSVGKEPEDDNQTNTVLQVHSNTVGESGQTNPRTTRTLHEAKAHSKVPIINSDFVEWASTYSAQPFNFLHCDFPYGVNVEQRKGQMLSAQLRHGAYADSPDTYWQLLTALAESQDRICAPSCHMMFWFSMDYYTETFGFFARHMPDWTFQPFPLYWSKSDNVGLLPDVKRGPRRVVETALIGSRGDRKIVQPVANHFACPTDRVHHMSTKPVPMLAHFFRMFVDDSSRFLDPTCGAGSSIVAARDAGAAACLGIERDPEFHRRACARYEGAPSGGEDAA